MLRSLLIILLATITLQLNAAAPKDTVVTKAYIESLEDRIQKLETTTTPGQVTKDRLDLINEKIDNLQGETERSTANIANQIGESSKTLTIWSIMFAIAGIAIAAFINTQQNKSSKHLEKSKFILGETQKILDTQLTIEEVVLKSEEAMLKVQDSVNKVQLEVNNTQELINNNLSELYHKLQLEEADYLISRLDKDPRDIGNIFSKLTTIPLPERYYNRLISVITGLTEMSTKTQVELLIVQHFPSLWLNEPEIKKDFANYYTFFIASMFVQELEDQLTALIQHYKNTNTTELDITLGATFLLYDCNIQYDFIKKNNKPVDFNNPMNQIHKANILARYERFYNNLQDKELRFAVCSRALVLTGSKNLSIANLKLVYGYLLLRDYLEDTTITEVQKLVLEVLEKEPLPQPEIVNQ